MRGLKRPPAPVLALLLLAVAGAARGNYQPVPMTLYQPDIDLSDYWVRERLHGIRAHWDGKRLRDTGGTPLTVPKGFTQGFPETSIIGELWLGRGSYGHLLAVVHRRVPDPTQWQSLYFMALDLPEHLGSFNERLPALRQLVRQSDAPHLRLSPHIRIDGRKELNRQLRLILEAGGAGLVLHRGDARRDQPARGDLLMIRPYHRGQGQVVAIIHDADTDSGLMTGLLLRSPGGRRFRLMAGFSEAQRRHPPPLGSIVEYKYYGYTADGSPRFMHFLRVREEGTGIIH